MHDAPVPHPAGFRSSLGYLQANCRFPRLSMSKYKNSRFHHTTCAVSTHTVTLRAAFATLTKGPLSGLLPAAWSPTRSSCSPMIAMCSSPGERLRSAQRQQWTGPRRARHFVSRKAPAALAAPAEAFRQHRGRGAKPVMILQPRCGLIRCAPALRIVSALHSSRLVDSPCLLCCAGFL